MSKRETTSIASMILLAVASAGLAQSRPEAMEVLKKVGETYRSMKTLQVEANVAMDIQGEGMQQKMDIPMVMTIASPNKMRMESKSALASMRMISDGQTIWLYMPLLNKYSKLTGLGSDGRVLDAVGAPGFSGFAGQFKNVAERVKEAKILRSETLQLDGVDTDCYVIEVTYEPRPKSVSLQPFGKPTDVQSSPHTLWIDKTRFLILRESSEAKMTLGTSTVPTVTKQTVTFSKVKIDDPVSDDLFVFTPPDGATEMDLRQFLPPGSAPHN